MSELSIGNDHSMSPPHQKPSGRRSDNESNFAMSEDGQRHPSSRWYVPEFNDKTKFTLSIGALIGLVMGMWAVAVWQINLTKALEENTKAVQQLAASVWTIQDSVDYAYKYSIANPDRTVPDPKSIVRERLKP